MQKMKDGYLPIQFRSENQKMEMRWLYFGDYRFQEPFFDETISHAKYNLPQEEKPVWLPFSETDFEVKAIRPPDLIVYHVSRCGSTLIGQLLGQHPDVSIHSETPLLDELLEHRTLFSQPELVYKNTVHLLRRDAIYQIIKTDSWHLFHSEFLHQTFPDTPAILLYRDPVSVWKSHKRQPGMQVVPGLLRTAQLGDFDSENYRSLPHDLYFAQYITSCYERMLELAKANRGVLVNYDQGAQTMAEISASLTNISIDKNLQSQIELRAKQHSKRPYENFSEEAKNPNTPDFLKKAMELYMDLETIRLL
jgi:hypothetical protein